MAVWQIVEAASKSKFWNQMAIFIVEDDAQNGPDHLDSHRTTAFVASPYVKRGVVDSTPYTQVSMVRTIELIFGLPPMTQYDAAAVPMYNSEQSTCDPVAYATQKAGSICRPSTAMMHPERGLPRKWTLTTTTKRPKMN